MHSFIITLRKCGLSNALFFPTAAQKKCTQSVGAGVFTATISNMISTPSVSGGRKLTSSSKQDISDGVECRLTDSSPTDESMRIVSNTPWRQQQWPRVTEFFFFLVFGWCNGYISQSWQRKVLNDVSLIGNVMWRRAFRHGRLTRFEAVKGLHEANSAGHVLSEEDRGSNRFGKKPRLCVHGFMVLNLNYTYKI